MIKNCDNNALDTMFQKITLVKILAKYNYYIDKL